MRLRRTPIPGERRPTNVESSAFQTFASSSDSYGWIGQAATKLGAAIAAL